MPGSPDPVLGSDALTVVVAAVVAAGVVALPLLRSGARRDPRTDAVGGGVAYACLCIGTWAGVRFLTDSFVSSLFERPLHLAGLLAFAALVFALQAAIPLFLYARYGLASPLAALFGLTTLVLFVFLRVRGESDPLALYVLFFGPLLVGGLVAVALVELGVRRGVETMQAR